MIIGDIIAGDAGRTLLLLCGAVLLTIALRIAVRHVEREVSERRAPARGLQRTTTLTKVLSSGGITVIWSITAMQVLDVLGFNVAPLLAGISIGGLAVGFGAQNLVRDVVSGLLLLVEDQYGIGDHVTINDKADGTVEELTLRLTGVRDKEGSVHYLANGTITHVENHSKDYPRAVIDIVVDDKIQLGRVRGLVEDIAQEAAKDRQLDEKLNGTPYVVMAQTETAPASLSLIADTKARAQVEVARWLSRRLSERFSDAGVGAHVVPGDGDLTRH